MESDWLMAVEAPKRVKGNKAKKATDAAKPPKRWATKGRGCGAGQDLGPRGEPRFEDLPPSWQAVRRLKNRQAKAMHKDLRPKD